MEGRGGNGRRRRKRAEQKEEEEWVPKKRPWEESWRQQAQGELLHSRFLVGTDLVLQMFENKNGRQRKLGGWTLMG